MKFKNALKKVIHSVCLISVLFLSVFFVLPASDVYSDNTFRLYVKNYGYTDVYTRIEGFISGSWTQVEYFWGTQNVYLDPSYIYRIYSDVKYYDYQGSYLSTDIDSPLHLTAKGPNQNYSRIDYDYDHRYSGMTYQYFTLPGYIAPTPTPTPTPTPEPASPTPNANAEAFFGKLGSDAQNGFGAILTAWTAANSHFYTSVLFIVLPVFLGIVGLIASFFFGGGDDD